MLKISAVGRAVLSVLVMGACTDDPSAPEGAVTPPRFAVGDSCVSEGDVGFGCEIVVDGSPPASGFNDSTGSWKYWAKPGVATSGTNTFATLEYRFKDATSYGYRVVDLATYEKGAWGEMTVYTNLFGIEYVREAVGSKFVGYAGWDGSSGHLETRYCISNPAASGFNCMAGSEDPMSANRLPNAAFTVAQTAPYAPDHPAEFAVDGAPSSDPDNNGLTYTWFLDGASVGAGITYLISIGSTGVHNIRLLVDDGNGGIDAANTSVTVEGPPTPNRAPTAVISAAESRVGVVGGACALWSFDGRNSSDPDGDPLTYQWAFDGAALSPGSATISKEFCTSGAHSARLVVSDGRGGSSDVTQGFTVSPFVSSPLTAAIQGPSPVMEGATCSWDGMPTGGTGPYRYTWKVAGVVVQDGIGASTYTRTIGGTKFMLALTITDANGLTASASLLVWISPEAARCYL